MILWAIFAVLTAGTLFLLLRPLLRDGGSEGTRADFDAAVYRDQLREIDSDRDRGLIGAAEAEAARNEIARRLLAADVEGNAGGAGAARLSPRTVAAGLAVLLPLLTLSIYLYYGSPRLPDLPLFARLQAQDADRDLQALVAQVEERLREHPDQGQGWDVIAPVYLGFGRFADAADAYERANRLLGESPKRLVGQGRALVFAGGGVVSEDARKALERALVLDPNQIDARLLLILAKEQDGKLAEAASEWQALLAKAPANAPWRLAAEKRLADVKAKLEVKPAVANNEVAAATEASNAERQAMIERMVSGLASRLAENGDDLPGWLKLVRSYAVLERKDDALKALERARNQFTGNAGALRELDTLAAELGLKS